MGYIRRNIVRPPTRPISSKLEEVSVDAKVDSQPSVSAVMMIETIKPVEQVKSTEPILNQLPPTEAAYQQRNLWTDNVWRTRNFYISYLYNFNDLTVARSFLDQNLRDLGNSIKPYYGNGAGDRLQDTLESRLTAFINVLEYIKTAPVGVDLSADPNLGQRLLAWKDRSDAVFDVLATLNPAAWNKTEVRNIVDNSRDFWWNQLQARHRSEWVRDLTFLDYCFDNAARMAGVMLRGIPT